MGARIKLNENPDSPATKVAPEGESETVAGPASELKEAADLEAVAEPAASRRWLTLSRIIAIQIGFLIDAVLSMIEAHYNSG